MIATAISSLIALASNPMFSGIVAASAIGGAAWALHEVPKKFWETVIHWMSVEVQIQNDNLGFDWVELWLSEQPYMRSRWLRRMRLTIKASETVENDDFEKVIAPGSGYHWMIRDRRLMMVRRWQEESSGANLLTNRKVEHFEFRMFFGKRERLLKFVDEAETRAKIIPGRIPLFMWAGGWWNKAPSLRPRNPNTVYLPDSTVEDIIKDAQEFTASSEWYVSKGVPYRRGYLLKGIPGAGKTTLAIMLASVLKRPVYVVPLSGVNDDVELSVALMSVPRNALLLFEDIDAAHSTKERDGTKKKEKDEENKGPTLGGLLNGIDGVFATEGRILVMTTNHPEKLDPALIRPGRIDYTVEFYNADSALMAKMFTAFYWQPYVAEQFETVPYMPPSMVQNVMMKHRNNSSVALAALEALNDEAEEQEAA